MELTVGYAAGLIALGTFLGRQFFPNALVYILSGILGNADSAATWTLSAPVFHQSYWPWLLRTDSAYSHGTRPAVQWISRLVPILSLLFAVTSIVTPLGLYEGLKEGKPVSAKFVYAKDPSVFGYATLSREGYTFSRVCATGGFGDTRPCPFTNATATVTGESDGIVSISFNGDGDSLNTTIPGILQQIYKSGTRKGSSIANYFDIQWRQFTQVSRHFNNATVDDEPVDTNITVGIYRNVQSLVLNDEVRAVDGLIVDTAVGRIGFRNHTVPVGFEYGSSWTEDILFLEPETACVDTNLTLDSLHDGLEASTNTNFRITDHGGFANLQSVLNNDTAKPDWPNNTQLTLDLHARAYWAALMFNFRAALYFNITNPQRDGKQAFMYLNSKVNDSFLLDARKTSSPNVEGASGYFMDKNFGGLFGTFDGYTDKGRPGHSSNTWNMSAESFSNITKLCQGVDSTTAAWSGLVNVACGLMRSPPFRESPGEAFRYDAGSKWSQKMFACASAAKISVKSVHFTFNGTTPTLKDLHVTKIQNHNYTDNSSMPIWGVEDYDLKWRNADLRQIWGLVSPYYEGKLNVSTYRKPEFYLPGYMPSGILDDSTGISDMNMPGSDLSEVGLAAAYCTPSSTISSKKCLGGDYSGSLDIGILQKWSNLSSKAETAAKIPNLIFTDILAAAVVGTAGLTPGEDSRVAQVTPNRLKVRYHMAFAVPALVCAVVLALLVVAVAVSWFTKRTTFHQIRLHIQRLSPGRIFTSLLATPEHRSTLGMSGKSWSEKYGPELVDLTEHDETADVGDHANGQPGKEKGSYVGVNVAEK